MDERRREPRTDLDETRVVLMEITYGEQKCRCWTNILDVSAHGIKAVCEVPMERGSEISAILHFPDKPFNARGVVAWQKEIAIGALLCGFEFPDLSPEESEQLNTLVQTEAMKNRRAVTRFPQTPPVQVLLSEHLSEQPQEHPVERSLSLCAIDLSTRGMRVVSEEKIPGGLIGCKIFLAQEQSVVVKGRVVWQRAIASGFIAGIQFEESEEEAIQQIINYLLSR